MKTILLSASLLLICTTFFCHAQTLTLWGMTGNGGQYSIGNIFQVSSAGTETNLHDFGNGTDGGAPQGSLIKASNSMLYGITQVGGVNNSGIIFSYDIATGIETDVHDFGSGTDGQGPRGSLIQVGDSLLYGLTQGGGTNGSGIIFSYNIFTGMEINLHNFGTGTDGENPHGNLTRATNGKLYGLTAGGGVNMRGTLFSYDISSGMETDLYDFGLGSDGEFPTGSLIQATNSLLYGVANTGGVNGIGIIFSYNISTNTETDVHDFSLGGGGYSPAGSLMQAGNGLLYGLTGGGGAAGYGVIFSFNTSNNNTIKLYDFGIGTDGQYPGGSLIQGRDSLLYGMTSAGGANGYGAVFNYSISATKENDIYDFTKTDGNRPFGDLLEDDTATIHLTASSMTICAGDTVHLTAGGATSYTWAPNMALNAATGASVNANPTITTTYTVSGSIDGLADTSVIVVKVNPIPTITASANPTFYCGIGSSVLSTSGALHYNWLPSTNLSETSGGRVTANPTSTTTYYITATDTNGCIGHGSVKLTVYQKPILTIAASPDTICSGAISAITVGGANTYTWAPSTGLNVTTGVTVNANPTTTTTYYVMGTDTNGCSITDSTILSVQICTAIPSLAANDNPLMVYPNPSSGQFIVKSGSSQKDYSVEVYSIVGEEIYHAELTNPDNTIDITGEPDGMYFVQVKSPEGTAVKKILIAK